MAECKFVLKDRVRLFCEEYSVDFNGKQAAIRAGYKESSAEVTASRLLSNDKVRAYLAELKKVASKRIAVDAEMIEKELKLLGFSNIQDYVGKGFKINEISDLPREKAAAIQSIKTKTVTFEGRTTTEVEFKLHNKPQALDMLSKHVGFYAVDNAQAARITIDDSTFHIVRRKK